MAGPNALNGELPRLTIGNYVDNKTLNQAQNIPHGLNKQQLSSPYLSEDPWAVAQETGQLILTHSDY